ncbi:MAG: peptidoglycan DD-metalloendopeptidase family protein, partial [Acidimicrobiia bacterium]|nr:peptidoglycan DD-metalloendopeptidase family protein [Acidimicrobiia bacterium]
PPPLDLPWPPPERIVPGGGGGPLGVLTAIWGNLDFPISQEFGHTEFSLNHPEWYHYGLDYGLDGREHPGLDIGMPAGTYLYAPVDGTVEIAGGTPYFTHYNNIQPGVGELLIRTDRGDQVVLGHMGRIAVQQGQRVTTGQFAGLSGGYNGDHLHLEARELQPDGRYRIVDPRDSFVATALGASSLPATAGPARLAPGVTAEVLGHGEAAVAPTGLEVTLARWEFAAGATMAFDPATPAATLLVVESGAFTVTAEVLVTVLRAAGAGTPSPTETEAVAAGATAHLKAGDSVVVPAGVAAEVGNEGSDPARILATRLAPTAATDAG